VAYHRLHRAFAVRVVVGFGVAIVKRPSSARGAFGGAAGMRFRKLQLWADELGLGGAFSSHIPTCDALT
jgi:hypothetical protein